MEEWLRSIGLGEHHEAFRDQGVTLDQVADLTDEDLRELGLNIGDRKRFRRAVTSLTPPSPPTTKQCRCSRRRVPSGGL